VSKAVLVLVNGMPCTGKSSLARVLAQRLELPCVGKDEIKEILFEVLGYSDRAWSQALGAASYELLYYFTEAQIRAGRSLIAEANFHAANAGPRLNALQDRYGFRTVQIICRTEPAVLMDRYRQRIASGERHPGHLDEQLIAEIGARAHGGEWEPVPVESELIIVDTTDFGALDYEGLAGRIRGAIAEQR
jgi:predicted kinase